MKFHVVRIENYLKHETAPEGIIEINEEGFSIKDETEYFNANVLPHIENPIISPLYGDEVDCTEDWESWLDSLYYLCNEEVRFIAK